MQKQYSIIWGKNIYRGNTNLESDYMKKPTSQDKIGSRRWHMVYAGLDLHKNLSVITVMDNQGFEIAKQKKLSNNGEHYTNLQKVECKRTPSVVPLDVEVTTQDLRTRVVDVVRETPAGVDIAKADILVSGGRGLGKKDNIALPKELDQALDGIVLCSFISLI